MPKKKKLSLGDLTVQSFVTELDEKQAGVKGGDIGFSVLYCMSNPGSCASCFSCNTCRLCPLPTNDGCTVNHQTCIGVQTVCNPADTFPGGGTICP
jgi:hypothetical protein